MRVFNSVCGPGGLARIGQAFGLRPERQGAWLCRRGIRGILPAMPPDPDWLARRSLARHRAFATGLLVLMAALTLISYALPPGWGADLLQARAGELAGLGARIIAEFDEPEGHWITMADPEGNEFCLQ